MADNKFGLNAIQEWLRSVWFLQENFLGELGDVGISIIVMLFGIFAIFSIYLICSFLGKQIVNLLNFAGKFVGNTIVEQGTYDEVNNLFNLVLSAIKIPLFVSAFFVLFGTFGTSLDGFLPVISMIFVVGVLFFIMTSLLKYIFLIAKDNGAGFNSLKTVTFGDESSVVANRLASILGVITIFILWGVATESKLLPFSLPGPANGDYSFEYTAKNVANETDKGTVSFRVFKQGEEVPKLEVEAGNGFAKDDAVMVLERRNKIFKPQNNDEGGKGVGYEITEIDGFAVSRGEVVEIDGGEVLYTNRGSFSIRPSGGMTMEALFLPPPEKVWNSYKKLRDEGYQDVSLWENVFWSLARVFIGFGLGCLFGIPLGYAMGLNGWLRGWFDPIVEFMRPVPPLALIPLVIIWFGIGEQGKISLLFLAALWIMTIAARSGVSGVNISKVHAAYSLGASKPQILSRVIIPNSLPDIFTGARVAMGVCWGTVVAAELVAAEKGIGKMIIAASKFQLTDIVIVGIVIIGIIGFGIEVLMRIIEKRLIPWKGKG
ncbi:MAG: ABC transporter permease subunit [Hyphomicrobiales bacterium]